MMNDLNVIFMGTPEFAVPVLEKLIENTRVIAVVTQPDKEVGRHHELKASPIKELALAHDIRVIQPNKIREEYQEIVDLNPDIIITCAYGQIIPDAILECPHLGCINVHASLLPKLRGGAPIHHAIIDGYNKTGITIMYMDSKMDTGDIIAQRECPIYDIDNVGTLHDKLSKIGAELLMDTLPSLLIGAITRTKQNDEEATKILVNEAGENIRNLINLGVKFDKDENGNLVRGVLGYFPYIVVGFYCFILIFAP